jgi:hypothetical protein
VEGLGDEFAPEGLDAGEGTEVPACAFRGGKAGGSHCCHDAGSLFSFAAQAALSAVFRAENQLWPDLLKTSFKCSDSPPTWCRPRIHPW